MTWLLWRTQGARFLTVDLWRIRILFRVSPGWDERYYGAWMVDWWWKDDYQMHHWLADNAERFGDAAYGPRTMMNRRGNQPLRPDGESGLADYGKDR